MRQVETKASASNAAPSLRTILAQSCRGLRRDLMDSYRPERHYMRGPGPKCREKARLQSLQNDAGGPSARSSPVASAARPIKTGSVVERVSKLVMLLYPSIRRQTTNVPASIR
jgi:hypothetical protein